MQIELKYWKIATGLLRKRVLNHFTSIRFMERNKTQDQHLQTGTKIREQILIAEYI